MVTMAKAKIKERENIDEQLIEFAKVENTYKALEKNIICTSINCTKKSNLYIIASLYNRGYKGLYSLQGQQLYTEEINTRRRCPRVTGRRISQ